jgi:ABC-2 type transport system permease protein
VLLDRGTGELQRRARTQTRVRRELLAQLVRKDLKVKYQNSVLGFTWSLMNPLFLLAVYYFVFQVVLKTGIKNFPVYLMSGLLIWNFFSSAVVGAASSVVGNAGLVKKVRFPLSVLPFSAVGFALVHYVLQMGVLLAGMLLFGYDFIGLNLLLAVPAIGVAILFATALGWLVSALNVRYRDTAHLLELVMIAWFWLTPSIYANGLVRKLLEGHGIDVRVYFLDPMAAVVASMQRAIYATNTVTNGVPADDPRAQFALVTSGYGFYAEMLASATVVSVLLMLLARSVFRRMSSDFAEDL